MKIRHLLASAMLVLAAPAMATPITLETFNLGLINVPTIEQIGNSFSSAGFYQDDFNFSINTSASAGALVLEVDPWLNKLDFSITSIVLSGVGTFLGPNVLGLYDFGTLQAGDYTLSIFSSVTRTAGFYSSDVGYGALLGLKAANPTSVPEPGTLALLGLGLIGMAFVSRRRASAN